jgi:hypothetical protein
MTPWAEVSHLVIVTGNTECSGKTGVAFGNEVMALPYAVFV